MATALEKNIIDLYFSNVDILEERATSAMNRARSAALESFNLLGLPVKGSANNDLYHYTNLEQAFEGEYEHYFTPSYSDIEVVVEEQMPAYRISLLNHFCSDEAPLATLDNGIIYGSLSAAAETHPELVESCYNSIANNNTDGVVALSTAFTQDGAFVFVPRGVTAEYPFIVESNLYAERESIAGFVRHLLIFEEGSHAKLLIRNRTLAKERFLSAQTRELFVGSGAQVELLEVTEFNEQSTLIINSFARQANDSRFSALSVALSGQLLRSNLNVKLEGAGAENHTNGLFICGVDEQIDFHTNVEHLVSDCTSNELFKGIAARGGTGVFNGRIYVAPDAQRTLAFQQNHNLLLSDDAHIYAKPQLEIYADNVKCSHGATVGQLDHQAIYYMRQRGISEADARRLQMYGFVNDVIERTDMEGVQESLSRLAADKIGELE